MLFVISTNDPKVKDISNGSWTTSVEQWDAEKLDNLVKRVNEDAELEDNEKDTKKGLFSMFGWGKDKNLSLSGSVESSIGEVDTTEIETTKIEKGDASVKTIGDIVGTKDDSEEEIVEETVKEEEKWFFNKLFWKDDTASGSTNDDEDDSNTESPATDNKNDTAENESTDTKEDTKIVSNVWVSNQNGNLVKAWGHKTMTNASDRYMSQYSLPKKTVEKNMYPWMNLKTAIGKEFQVGVHTLKLNNAYFNTTLAYMSHGDRLKQLTSENSYGCFQIEILSAKRNYNVGKKGYVCKKYLKNVGDTTPAANVSAATPSTTPMQTHNTSNSHTTPSNNVSESTQKQTSTQKYTWVQTQVGDLILVENTNYTFPSGHKLYYWDTLDQMTNLDENGCFTAHVSKSSNPDALGHVARVCMNNIK